MGPLEGDIFLNVMRVEALKNEISTLIKEIPLARAGGWAGVGEKAENCT